MMKKKVENPKKVVMSKSPRKLVTKLAESDVEKKKVAKRKVVENPKKVVMSESPRKLVTKVVMTKTKTPVKQVILQLKSEDASTRAKLLAIRTGAWKDKNPGRVARRKLKAAALKSLVEDHYTTSPANFLDAAVTFYNEF